MRCSRALPNHFFRRPRKLWKNGHTITFQLVVAKNCDESADTGEHGANFDRRSDETHRKRLQKTSSASPPPLLPSPPREREGARAKKARTSCSCRAWSACALRRRRWRSATPASGSTATFDAVGQSPLWTQTKNSANFLRFWSN